jgi:hypothetical protein
MLMSSSAITERIQNMPKTNTRTNTETGKVRLTEKTLQKLSLRELVDAYNGLNAGQPKAKASAFKTKADAVRRIKALQRRIRRTALPSTGTVRELAERLLMEPKRYSEILEEVREVFPDCQTSRSSLRWYAAQMRQRGESLPERPLDI